MLIELVLSCVWNHVEFTYYNSLKGKYLYCVAIDIKSFIFFLILHSFPDFENELMVAGGKDGENG